MPPDDPFVAQCVARAPGDRTHVPLDDRIAEQFGCNMAFRGSLPPSMVQPVYLRAGDDVDICWRLQAKKQRIGFSPSALVWHHHRPSIKAHWRQQVSTVRRGVARGPPPREVRTRHHAVARTDHSPPPFIRAVAAPRQQRRLGTALFPSATDERASSATAAVFTCMAALDAGSHRGQRRSPAAVG